VNMKFPCHDFGWYTDSSNGIALGYGLEVRGSRVRFPAGAGNFSLHHRVQNGSGAHPVLGTRGSFPGGKAAELEADHSPPSSAEVKECVELYLHFPNTPSWRGAQLQYGDYFTLTFGLPFYPYRGQFYKYLWGRVFGSMGMVKGKVVPVLNEAPRHEDVPRKCRYCSTHS
jgi:hypothetical protein